MQLSRKFAWVAENLVFGWFDIACKLGLALQPKSLIAETGSWRVLVFTLWHSGATRFEALSTKGCSSGKNITHRPPFGILDQVRPGGEHLGCAELLESLEQKKPKVHLFGRIHGGAGILETGTTRFVNAAYLNEQYRPSKPAGEIRIIDV